MKKLPSVKAILIAIAVICSIEFITNRLETVTILSFDRAITPSTNAFIETIVLKNERERLEKESKVKKPIEPQEIEIISLKASTPMIVFDGMTMEELSEKLNRSLHSDLEGYGSSYAKYAIEYGVDPYLAVSISLLETGCNWGCSSLVTNCNNVGGMKGQGGCNGGSYAVFDSLDSGIESMIRNLSVNYIQKGLVTPEQINTKYASSSTWAMKVNNYIEQVKNAE